MISRTVYGVRTSRPLCCLFCRRTLSSLPPSSSTCNQNSPPPSSLLTSSAGKTPSSLPKSPVKEPLSSTDYVSPPGRIRRYLGQKVVKFIEGYEEILKKFPSVYRVYRVFSVGTKELYQDSVEYLNLFGRDVRSLSHRQLLIHYETPKALLKVTPTLLISALPFANYVVFPLAYMFPKKLLSHHFWTLDQRVNFQLQDSISRLKYYKPVFRHLQNKQSLVHDVMIRSRLYNILSVLGSGLHPPVEDLVYIKKIFSGPPYSLDSLNSSHLSDLCRIHGLRHGLLLLGRKYRLTRHAALLREMDLAIEREGGSANLPTNDLRKACALRGLNPVNTSSDQLSSWLSVWLSLSEHCNEPKSFSLLLHTPIFLSYNHPSNWRLKY